MSVVRTPDLFYFVAFGVDEPNSSEPAKGLKKRGCFRCEVRYVLAGKRRMGQRGLRERASLYFSTSFSFSHFTSCVFFYLFLILFYFYLFFFYFF